MYLIDSAIGVIGEELFLHFIVDYSEILKLKDLIIRFTRLNHLELYFLYREY